MVNNGSETSTLTGFQTANVTYLQANNIGVISEQFFDDNCTAIRPFKGPSGTPIAVGWISPDRRQNIVRADFNQLVST